MTKIHIPMKKILLFALTALCLTFVACNKDSDSSSENNNQAATYAAAMAGVYNLSAETNLYENGQLLEGEHITGTLTLTNTSANNMVATLVEDNKKFQSITGTVDNNGIFHLTTFVYGTVTISELSSTIKLTSGNLLSGVAHCRLVMGSDTREAQLSIRANRQ